MVAIEGRTVVVTGGRRGLGAALVNEVLARGARRVYATARTAYTDPRPEVVTVQLEVTSADSVAQLADLAADAEIVINNAGVLYAEPLLTGDPEHIASTFDVNTLGCLRIARAFAPILATNGGGALIDIHSVLSWLGGSGAYCASKAAAWSLTNSLRLELAHQNTQVVGVHAAFIDTEMVAALDQPKASPADVAFRIIDGLQAGAVEVLADDLTVAAKKLLAGQVENLTLTALN